MRANNRRILNDNPQTQSPNRPDTADDSAPSSVDVISDQFDSSSMAVTALVILSALFFLFFFAIYVRRIFAGNYGDEQSHRRPRRVPLPPYRERYGYPSSSSAPGLDPAALRTLPILSYSGAGKEQAGCVVCLSELEEKETVKAIPGCGHVFHPECIDAWLLCHGSCPLCRSTQLFGLSLRGEMHGELDGGSTGEQTADEEGTDSVEMARRRDVNVEVAVEGVRPQERELDTGKKPGLGRSGSWCRRTDQRAPTLRRSHSL